MDKLLKLSKEHQEVFESLALFKQAMKVTSHEEEFVDIGKLRKFFQEYVLGHFQYEENQIFPKVLRSGLPAAKRIVRELQKDHIEVYVALDRFQDLAAAAGTCPTRAMKKKLSAAVTAVVEKIIPHARKEDSIFFPLVKKLGIKI